MNSVSVQQSRLFFALGITSLVLWILSFGPGLFQLSSESGIRSIQHHLFSWLCHQDPERTIHFHDHPMAVCARCFGIYTGFFVGLLMLPVASFWLKYRFKHRLALLIIVICLHFVDVTGNYLGWWTNTFASRWILGFVFGTACIALLQNEFFKKHGDIL